jgi:hypothetical protein
MYGGLLVLGRTITISGRAMQAAPYGNTDDVHSLNQDESPLCVVVSTSESGVEKYGRAVRYGGAASGVGRRGINY